jgi:hypothetical protein
MHSNEILFKTFVESLSHLIQDIYLASYFANLLRRRSVCFLVKIIFSQKYIYNNIYKIEIALHSSLCVI